MRPRPRSLLAVAIAGAVMACGASSDPSAGGGAASTLTIYTSVTQDTVDAVEAGFASANPEAEVDVFRAPTGELTARIATELEQGDFGADVLWLTDPLSIQPYAADGLLRTWTPAEVEAVPEAYRTDTYFGTRLLNLVIVAQSGLEDAPEDWTDLTELSGVVAVPDPGFAGSAFAALAFFAETPEYGMDFYRSLEAKGAVQVQAPGDVITGVAESEYLAGITLDKSARDAIADGSPIDLIWPDAGAIAVYSPIAVIDGTDSPLAEPFVDHVLSREGQEAVAATGWQPIRPDVEWSDSGPQREIDWIDAFDRQDELLDEYRSVFTGS